MIDAQVAQSVGSAVSDITQLGQPVAWALGMFFLRDVYREFKELRRDVHGPEGIGERVARLEGAKGSGNGA